MRKVHKILASIKEDQDDCYMAEGGDEGEESHKDKYARMKAEA
jgi:hypothetical protein